VASPDAQFKQSLTSAYHGRDRRSVLSLSTHGQHSRPDGKFNLNAVSYEQGVIEAIADWWLIGEADLLVLEGPGSFGTTAAARRPHGRSVYRVHSTGTAGQGGRPTCGPNDFAALWAVEPQEVNATSAWYRSEAREEHFRRREHKAMTMKLWQAMQRTLSAQAGGTYAADSVQAAVEAAHDPELLEQLPDLLRSLVDSGFVWDEGQGLLSFHLPPAVTSTTRAQDVHV
jgi:hypothetical protein